MAVEKKKEVKTKTYNVTIKYIDGGVDRFIGVKSAGLTTKEKVLEIVDSTNLHVGISMHGISHFKIEEED